MGRKVIKFQVPERMFEEFFRLFPGHGERSRFLRKVISLAIQRRELKNGFAKEMEELATKEKRVHG